MENVMLEDSSRSAHQKRPEPQGVAKSNVKVEAPYSETCQFAVPEFYESNLSNLTSRQ